MLPTVWFFLWVFLWAVFFVTDGYDLGLGSLHLFVARTDSERRTTLSTMAPFWDPNQVWIIAAGGMTFAVFPIVYAVLFSSLYSAFMLVLFALIFRAVAFEFRNKSENPSWRSGWDLALALGSFLPILLLGILFANLFRGLPLDHDHNYHGNFLTLLNPYGLLGGMLFIVLFGLHGLLWLAYKTEGPLYARAVIWAKKFWLVLLFTLVVFLAATAHQTRLYQNFLRYPIFLVLPIGAVLSLILIRVFLTHKQPFWAFAASSATIFLTIFFTMTGLYPNLVPSRLDPAGSLTLINATSSLYTLNVMLVITLIFVPIIIAYQSWAHYIFKNKTGLAPFSKEEHY